MCAPQQLTLRIRFIKNITQIGLTARVCDLGVRAGAKREEFTFTLERRPAAAVGGGGTHGEERAVRAFAAPSSCPLVPLGSGCMSAERRDMD